jgi:hypothetical protein
MGNRKFYMKNIVKLSGIIALVAVIGFLFAACDSGGGGGGNSGSGGKLTINNLPSGQYKVIVFNSGTNISTLYALAAAIGSGSEIAASAPSNSNVFTIYTNTQQPAKWTGGGNFPVYLYSAQEQLWASVNFTNGTATANYSSFITVIP